MQFLGIRKLMERNYHKDHEHEEKDKMPIPLLLLKLPQSSSLAVDINESKDDIRVRSSHPPELKNDNHVLASLGLEENCTRAELNSLLPPDIVSFLVGEEPKEDEPPDHRPLKRRRSSVGTSQELVKES